MKGIVLLNHNYVLQVNTCTVYKVQLMIHIHMTSKISTAFQNAIFKEDVKFFEVIAMTNSVTQCCYVSENIKKL